VIGVHGRAANDTAALEQIFRDADAAQVQVVASAPLVYAIAP